jgi:hypothetical protein
MRLQEVSERYCAQILTTDLLQVGSRRRTQRGYIARLCQESKAFFRILLG